MKSLQALCVKSIAFSIPTAQTEEQLSTLPAIVKSNLLKELVKFDLLVQAQWIVNLIVRDGVSDLDLSNTASLTDRLVRQLGQHMSTESDVRTLRVAGTPPIAARTWRRLASNMEPLLSLDLRQSQSRSLLNSFSVWCEKLQYVCADSCPNVTDSEIATLLHRCKSLQELSVRRCYQLTDKSWKGLPERSYLLRLDIRECKLMTDRTLYAIAERCPTLLSLSLESQTFTDGITAIINNCINLESFAMPLCNVKEDSLFTIRNTNCRIKQLDLFGSRLKDTTLLFLFGNVFRNMIRANLSGVRNLSFEVFSFVCQRNPKMQSLSLKGHLSLVTDQYIAEIVKHMQMLQSIDIGLCRSVSNEAILSLIEASPCTLREVGLVGCYTVQDNVLQLIAQKCGVFLEKLSLGGCKLVTNDGIRYLASHCCNLRMICVKGTSVTESQPLIDLFAANPALQVVSLSGVKGASDGRVIQTICSNCPRISELYVSGVQVERAIIDQFIQVQPKCEVHGKRRRVSTSI